jgi:cytochrome b561/polyisoprenoid-binding protein YceI
MLSNSSESYGLVAQVLHWLTALLILTLLVLGVYMHDLPTNTPSEIDTKIWLYSLHKTLGILAFAAAIVRVIWALIQPSPYPLNSERKFESLLASTIHWVLYGSILLMPITGWLHHASLEGFAPIWWPFAQDLPFIPKDPELARFLGAAHEFTAFLLISSLVLHIAGAMKHVLIDRDQTLSRMLPWKKVEISKSLNESENKASSRLFAGGIFVALLLALIASQMSFQKTSSQSDAITRSASTSGWSVDYTKSSLNIEIIQNNNPVQGSFSEWQADVIFDPDALDQASVEVRIKTASLILGGVTKDAISGNFLNVLEFPQAVFSSDKFFKVSDGKFQAVGDLTIAGITKPLILPFDLKIENGRAFMQSNVELQRLDYELGRQGYTTDGILGFAVKVNVMLEADKT